MDGHYTGTNIPVYVSDPWYNAGSAEIRNINYHSSSSAGTAYPTAYPTPKANSVVATSSGPDFTTGNTWTRLVKGHKLTTVTVDGTYVLKFDIMPHGKQGSWTSIFHMGGNNGVRIPGIWFYPNSNRLHFRTGTEKLGSNHGCDPSSQLPQNQVTSIEMTVTFTEIKVKYTGGLTGTTTCAMDGHYTGTNIPVYVSDPWYNAGSAEIRNINYHSSSSAGTGFPTAAPTAKPTAYPTTKPTAYPTPAPTGILSHATCKHTACTYTNGVTFVSTNKASGEKWHCEKVGNNCKCVCHASLSCNLRHHHTTGYKKTFTHC